MKIKARTSFLSQRGPCAFMLLICAIRIKTTAVLQHNVEKIKTHLTENRVKCKVVDNNHL